MNLDRARQGGRWKTTLCRLLLVLCLLSILTSCGQDLASQPLGGTIRSPTPNVGDIALPNVHDQTLFSLQAQQSDVLVLYFGYTSCPDVCPTTMADLSSAIQLLGEDASRISVAMLTIDPARDSNEIVGAYVDGFVRGGIGLRTTDDVLLRRTADRFGAAYNVSKNEAGEVEVRHTGFLYAIGADGNLNVSWAFGTPAAEIHHDLEILLARSDT